ncbi:AMP-binding protein [Kribbella qitaiheensis]|uniref:AMP-binding protein n=1 Tax=Kribbella qitaiheensis TaxID=1544730 RepID=A0A7G6X6J7_9ACTN|nr:AMP-binding protein [Kribbella qitaiheensis]
MVRNGADRPAISTGPALMIPAGYPRDLPSALLRAARDFDTSGVVEIGPDGRETRLDFPTLLELAARILAGLRAHGVRAGDPAVVHCTEPVGFFAAFWACTLGGIRPLLMAPAAEGDRTEEGRERLRKVTDLLGWTVLIGRPSDLPDDLGLPVLDPDALAGHEPTSEFHRPAADDVAVLMLSSGSSTGTPKIIQLTHRGLVEFAAGTPAMLPVRPGQTTLNWLPLDHSGAFLLYHLLPVFAGCTNIHVATDWVLANPLRWLDLMDAHRVNHSWSPNFGYRLVTAAIAGEPDRHWDLSALRSLVSGGEQITVPVVSEFLRLTNRFGVVPETFVAAWGMTETVTGITFARAWADAERAPGPDPTDRRRGMGRPADHSRQGGRRPSREVASRGPRRTEPGFSRYSGAWRHRPDRGPQRRRPPGRPDRPTPDRLRPRHPRLSWQPRRRPRRLPGRQLACPQVARNRRPGLHHRRPGSHHRPRQRTHHPQRPELLRPRHRNRRRHSPRRRARPGSSLRPIRPHHRHRPPTNLLRRPRTSRSRRPARAARPRHSGRPGQPIRSRRSARSRRPSRPAHPARPAFSCRGGRRRDPSDPARPPRSDGASDRRTAPPLPDHPRRQDPPPPPKTTLRRRQPERPDLPVRRTTPRQHPVRRPLAPHRLRRRRRPNHRTPRRPPSLAPHPRRLHPHTPFTPHPRRQPPPPNTAHRTPRQATRRLRRGIRRPRRARPGSRTRGRPGPAGRAGCRPIRRPRRPRAYSRGRTPPRAARQCRRPSRGPRRPRAAHQVGRPRVYRRRRPRRAARRAVC